MSEEIYLVLPSNVAPETYPKNEPNHYYTPLSQPLYLDSPGWKVALKEITYQNIIQSIVDEHIEVWQDQFASELVERVELGMGGKYLNITSRTVLVGYTVNWQSSDFKNKYHTDLGVYFILEGNEGPQTTRFPKVENAYVTTTAANRGHIALYASPLPRIVQTIRLRETFYSNKRKLLEEINRQLAPNIVFSVVMDHEEKRIQLSSMPTTHHLMLRKGMHDVLGFKETELKTVPHTAFYKADLSRGSFAMFVYCDLIDDIVVGDTLVPLLRTVHQSTLEHGAIVNQIFNPPIYLNISKSIVSNIEIEIRTDTGEYFPLRSDGKMILTLHMKRD